MTDVEYGFKNMDICFNALFIFFYQSFLLT